MYNQTTKSFTVKDTSGSFSWITEDADPKNYKVTDIKAWVDEVIEIAKENEISAMEALAETLDYPRFGYSTAEVYQDADEYLQAKRAEIVNDLEGERQELTTYLTNWVTSVEDTEDVLECLWVDHAARISAVNFKSLDDAKDSMIEQAQGFSPNAEAGRKEAAELSAKFSRAEEYKTAGYRFYHSDRQMAGLTFNIPADAINYRVVGAGYIGGGAQERLEWITKI